MISRRKVKGLLLAFLLLAAATTAQGQSSSGSEDEERGFTLFSSVQSTSNSFGHFTRFDAAPGYDFNRHFGVFGGIPVFIVRPSSTGTASGMRPVNGLGNMYVGGEFRARNPVLNYVSTLTSTLPTGDTDSGLSTGRVTVDWNNHFDRAFFRFTPFANLGLANTVSDTPLFTRPFSTSGFVSHYEMGSSYRVWRSLGVGASAYAIVPAGEQKVFSRLVQRRVVLPGTARRGRVFELQGETIGSANLTRDNGFAAWIEARPASFLSVQLGYNRSVRYALDSVSFIVRVDVRALARRASGQ